MSEENPTADSNKMADAPTPPSWLDAAFVQEALRRGGVRNIGVSDISLEIATAPGDNYSSVIYRTKAVVPLLVKTPPLGEMMSQGVKEMAVFKREAAMLAEVIPKLEAILEAAAPGRFPPMAARCPHHGTEPADFIVLEDLKQQGFKMADRHQGLGLRHSLLALRALGRFHAASAALLQKDPGVQEQLGQPWGKIPPYEAIIATTLQATTDACREWEGFEDIADRLEAFKSVAAQKYIDLQSPREGELNVVLHGDFWTNNMMFRYEQGRPQEIRFVDLQLSHVASPAIDVLYFLTTSISEDVSLYHEDLLVREYHKALSDAMVLLNLQPISLKDLQSQMDYHGAFALFGTTVVLPIVKATKAVDIGATMSGDEQAGTNQYKNPGVKKAMQHVLPVYAERGWLPR